MKSVVSATEFKAKCLAYLDDMEQGCAAITITRRGRPVAVLGPARRKAWKSLRDTMAGKVRIAADIVNADTSDQWDVVTGH